MEKAGPVLPGRSSKREGWCALQVSNLPKTADCLGNTDSDAPISAPISPACPDLQKVIEAWPELSEPLRRAILAIANSATEKGGQ
jgi:hypothetical protein